MGKKPFQWGLLSGPIKKFPPGLSFVGEPESFLPLKRSRCCEPYTTINTFLLHYPLLHLAFINQNSSAEEALMLEGLLQPPHPPHPNQPKSSAEEAWGICQKYWNQTLFNRNTGLQTQVSEMMKLFCLGLLHWLLVPGIKQVFTFAKSS